MIRNFIGELNVFPKFILQGILNTSLSYLIFLIIFSTTDSVLLALVIVSIIGTTMSFIFNKRFVFMKSHAGSLKKFLYLQTSIISLNWLILHVVSILGYSRTLAQIGFACFFAIFNYYFSSRYIFID